MTQQSFARLYKCFLIKSFRGFFKKKQILSDKQILMNCNLNQQLGNNETDENVKMQRQSRR